MARAVGAQSQILIDEEDVTYAVDNLSPDGRQIKFLTSDLKSEQNLIQDESITVDRNREKSIIGNQNVSGTIVANLDETSNVILLKHLIGANVTTGAGDPFTHTMKMGALPAKGLTIEKGFTDISEFHKFNGCRIASADIEVVPEGHIKITYNILGAKETRSATSYDATPTVLAYTAFSALDANMAITEGGSSIAIVKSFKLTINNQLTEDLYVIAGGGIRKGLDEGQAMVTGEITVFFEDDILLAKARDSTETALVVTLDKNATPARSLVITVPELIYGRSGPEITGPQGVEVTLPFEAFFDNATEATSLQIVAQNGLTTI